MNLNQISFAAKRPTGRWISEFLMVGIQIARVSTRFAGHCYSTTYNYPCVEMARLRKDGTIRWEKVSQWGCRCGPGRLHSGYGPGHLPDANRLHPDSPGYDIPFALPSV